MKINSFTLYSLFKTYYYYFNNIYSTSRAFSTISAAFGLFYVTTMLLCVYLIKERSEKSNAQGNPPLVPSLLSTFRNTPFMTLLPSWAMDMTSVTMIGT